MNEYVILLEGNGSVTVLANSCEWDSDTIEFYNTKEDIVAMFKMNNIIGWFRKLQNLIQEDKI